ncbi:MAG: tetratricopeptide repeat protein [Nitrospirae bacterium]|nr:tetratricopeptide repeat protein [Nitrospirota bacterium]
MGEGKPQRTGFLAKAGARLKAWIARIAPRSERERRTLLGFAIMFLLATLWLAWKAPDQAAESIWAFLAATVALVVVAAIDPTSILKFWAGRDGFGFERHKVSPEEANKIADLAASDQPSPAQRQELENFANTAQKRPESQRAPEDFLLLATSKQRAGDAEGALHLARTGLDLNPESPRTRAALLNLLGAAYADLGNDALAEARYRAAMAADPTFPWPHNNLGVRLATLGRHAEAEAEFREAIRIDPQNAMAHNNLGVLLLAKLGRADEAQTHLDIAERLRGAVPPPPTQ